MPSRPPVRSRRRATTPAAVLLLLGAAAPGGIAGAQHADSLGAGARVRVQSRFRPPGTVTGVLARADDTSLTIATHGRLVVVPRADVLRLDRHAGQRPAGRAFARGAWRGALVGAGIGAVATSLAYLAERRDPCGDCFVNAPMFFGAATVPFTLLTTLVGGGVGVARRDLWEQVPLR